MERDCTIKIRNTLRILLHNAIARERQRVSNILESISNYDSSEYREYQHYGDALGEAGRHSIILCPFCNKIGNNMVFIKSQGLWVCISCYQKYDYLSQS